MITEDYIFPFLLQPLFNFYREFVPITESRIYVAVAEPFLIYLKLAFFIAVFLCIPIFGFHIFNLTTKNKYTVLMWKYLGISYYYHAAGFIFVYYGIVQVFLPWYLMSPSQS